MKKKKLHRILLIALLTIILLVTLIPIYWSLVMAFDADTLDYIPNPPRLFPQTLSIFNFEYAFQVIPLARYFLNTTFLTIVNSTISVFFALTAGYAFAKGKFRLKNFWFLVILAVMMIPFEAKMVPLFLMYSKWNMLNTYFPLMLGAFAYVYGIFLARQNIQSIPDSLRESAFIDGASEWRTFFSIIIPLSGPLIATLSILQVITHWNSFLWPLICISDKNKQLISVGIAMFNASEGAMYFGPRMAAAIVAAAPLVVMFLFLQKYIVGSIAFSGIKQ